MLIYHRKILPAEAIRQLLSLVLFTRKNVLRRRRKREPALDGQLAQAPLYFAGENYLETYRTVQRTNIFSAQRLRMSGGLSLPTASTTRSLENATSILMWVVRKRRALLARSLVTAVRERDLTTPARLCLDSAVVDACGIGWLSARCVELAVSHEVC